MTGEQLRETERWFYRRGLPFLVEDYRSSTDVWTRATPFLVAAFFVMIVLATINGEDPWLALLGLGSALVLLAGYAAWNVRRGRPWNALPRRVTWPVLAAFIAVPTLVAVVSDGTASAVLESLALAAGVLLLTWVVTRYAVLPLLAWAVRYTFRGSATLPAHDPGPSAHAAVHHVPVHQHRGVAGRGATGRRRLWSVIGLFVLLGVVFILGRVPRRSRASSRPRAPPPSSRRVRAPRWPISPPTSSGLEVPVPLLAGRSGRTWSSS